MRDDAHVLPRIAHAGGAGTQELADAVAVAVAALDSLMRGVEGDSAYARLEAALDAAERIYLGDLLATADLQEGVDAFLAKRKPVWKGR